MFRQCANTPEPSQRIGPLTELSLTHFKRCPKCRCTKPATRDFYSPKKNGTLYSWCRRCTSLQNRIRDLGNTEGRKAYYKRWAANSRDKLNANSRRYWEANRENHNSRVQDHRKRNLAQYATKQRNREALKRNAPGAHTDEDVQEMYESQGGLCAYCEIPLDGVYHVDHMVPLSRGGGNGWENLAISCPPCNLSKHDRTAEEFMQAALIKGSG